MSDLISREKAYEVLSEYYHHKTETQHKALREALDMVPPVDIDLSDYSDRLWRNAYEQGKAVSKDALDEAYAHGYTAAEADFHKKNQWIPVTERLPEEPFGCIVSYHGFMLTPHGEREYDAIYPETLGYDGSGWNNSEGECVDNMIDVTAWMPLPEPWKGESDAEIR